LQGHLQGSLFQLFAARLSFFTKRGVSMRSVSQWAKDNKAHRTSISGRKLPGANAATCPVDEMKDTVLIHFVWNFGKGSSAAFPGFPIALNFTAAVGEETVRFARVNAGSPSADHGAVG
jgi:hypothetical protein